MRHSSHLNRTVGEYDLKKKASYFEINSLTKAALLPTARKPV